MALRECAHCHKAILSDVLVCPFCGRTEQPHDASLIWVGLLLIALAAGALWVNSQLPPSMFEHGKTSLPIPPPY
jgi:RNA polymerase subunit RPABC4/transcription elongation factor Spt4